MKNQENINPNKGPWQWNFGMVLFIILLWFAVTQLMGLFFEGSKHTISMFFIGAILQFICIFEIPYAITKKKTGSLHLLGFIRSDPFETIKIGITRGLVIYLMTMIVSAVITILFPQDRTTQQIVQLVLQQSNPIVRFGLVLGAVVLAPIGEEVFFRGILFTLLKNKLGKWCGVIISSAIFAALHFDIWAFMPIFIGSIILCLLYHKYGNICINILAHATWNGITIAILLWASSQGL
ncbi:MAG: CPBP family intramembrane glutamic endopeptidase [Bacillota bacterium]|jgi:membrane protease YdiL (CAAX protease family)